MLSNPSSIHPLAKVPSLYPRPPLLSSLTLSWQNIAMGYLRQPGAKISDVAVPWHCITICTTPGIVKRKLDGIEKNDRIVTGDIIVTPAQVEHSVCWQDERDTILIGLDPILFAYAIDDAVNFTSTHILEPKFATPDPLICQLGLALKNVLGKDPSGSRLYAETTASMLSIHLLQYYSHKKIEFKEYPDGLPLAILRRTIEYIQTNLALELGLTELATLAHLSPYYFARLFKRSTGLTPHQFVIRCRVKRAKELLLKGKDSIAEVAQQVGFANQAHLNFHCKRLLGITPNTILLHKSGFAKQQRKNL
jgi:AraC family transcriptional regulator